MSLGNPLLTTHDVAELLKVSETTIRSWIVGRELCAMRFGREYRIAVEDPEAFLEAHATRPAGTPDRAGAAGACRQGDKN